VVLTYKRLQIIAVTLFFGSALSRVGAENIDSPTADQINKRLPKGRVVSIEPARQIDPESVPPRAMFSDMVEALPAGLPVVTIEVDNDEAIAAGRVPGDWAGEAHVFDQPYDSGYIWPMKADEGNLASHRMIFGNRWMPGDELTGYDALVYVSTANGIGTASVQLELWDGDPLNLIDTTCSVPGAGPQPIPGTLGTFTDLPQAIEFCPPVPGGVEPTCVGLYRLRVTFPEPLAYDCDRAWATLTVTEGCRVGWRLSEGYMTGGSEYRPLIGEGDGMEWGVSCEFFGEYSYCPTDSGYSAGTCCDTGNVCDFTDADPANWTGDCADPTFCGDGVDEYWTYYDEAPLYYNNFVGSAWAGTDHLLYLVPVSADAPPEQNPEPDGWHIDGNEITLDYPGRTVWLEVRISELDREGIGEMLFAWGATIDSSGYGSVLEEPVLDDPPECDDNGDCMASVGIGSICEVPPECEAAGFSCTQCAALGMPCLCTPGLFDETSNGLIPYAPPCASDADCTTLAGAGATCDYPEWCVAPDCWCSPGFIDGSRSDFIFHGHSWYGGVLRSTPDFRIGGRVSWFDVPVPDFESYAGTIALEVPPGASGTFEVTLKGRNSRWPYYSFLDTNFPPYDGYYPLTGIGPPVRITIAGFRAPQPEPMVAAKNRYLSFAPNNPAGDLALRVTFADLPAPYDAWNGVTMWAGPPETYCENSGQGAEPPEGCATAPGQDSDTFFASHLQCEPHYRHWDGVCHEGVCVGGLSDGETCDETQDCISLLHVFHQGIVPGGVYEVQSILAGYSTAVEANYSDSLVVDTSRWCDLVKDCTTQPCSPPNGTVDITTDVTALINKFKNLGTAPSQVRTDLIGNFVPYVPDQQTTVLEFSYAVDAFLGFGYPFVPTGPPPCAP
jgi:hypothetical protein